MRATPWNTLKTNEELEAYYSLMASIDYAQAQKTRAFYESRTIPQLKVLAAEAWQCNEGDLYQLAMTYYMLRVLEQKPAL